MVVLCSVGLSGLLLLCYRKEQKRRRAALLTTMSQLGSRNNLSFSGQEVLEESVIGFDGLQKKLLVLEKSEQVYRWYTINLQEVYNCSVQKTYRVGAGSPVAAPPLSGYVNRVELVFHCTGNDHPLAVPFYRSEYNEAAELPALEARAVNWQRFLTKLLPAQQTGRA
jgi:hypothetical protein